MASRAEIYQAILNADKAGDSESVRTLGAYLKTMPDENSAVPAARQDQAPRAGSGSDVVDAGNAVGTGFFRGMTRLAGLPVDTAANMLDLGKAAIGAPYIALTGKAPPEWLQVGDRSNVVGSGDNLLKNVRKSGAGGMVDPVNPDYEGGYLQAAGGAATGVMGPKTWAQAGNQLAVSEAGALAGKAVGDATGDPALAITASMSPLAAQNLASAATKYAVRGNEAGRQNMAQRVADLKAAGVENPTLGLASGNQLIGGVENLLQSTPGAVGIMRRNRDTAISGLEANTGMAADLASTNRGALESGRSIQAGAKNFKGDFKEQQAALYDKLDKYIGKQDPVDVTNTRSTLETLNADIPTMPKLSNQFKNSRILAIEDALKSDMAGKPGSPGSTQAVIVDGIPMLQQMPGAVTIPARTEIPFEAVKKTRTLVGNEIADNTMMSDVPRSKWNPLYGALSQDMQGAATAAGPGATNAFNRANDYTRSGIGRLERIAPVVDRPAPEQSFTALNSTLKENLSTFQAVKKSLPEGTRGDFAGTVIERLGKAKAGQQDETGTKWSPETFLTNWSNIKPQAQRELLSGIPNAAAVKETIDAVAKATAMMRDNSKMWANPSGTAANATARGVLGAVSAGGAGALAGVVNPAIPISAAVGLGGVNLLARGVTSQKVREAMMRRTDIDPELQNALAASMFGSNLLGQNQKEQRP